jgi:hypothetical protein
MVHSVLAVFYFKGTSSQQMLETGYQHIWR